MKAGVFPPTLNYLNPDPEIDLKDRGSSLLASRLTGIARPAGLEGLRSTLSGFGGSNYVVQLEQAMDEAAPILVSPGSEPGLARETDVGLLMSDVVCRTSDVEFPASDLKKEPIRWRGKRWPPGLQGVSFFRARMDGRDCRMLSCRNPKKRR